MRQIILVLLLSACTDGALSPSSDGGTGDAASRDGALAGPAPDADHGCGPGTFFCNSNEGVCLRDGASCGKYECGFGYECATCGGARCGIGTRCEADVCVLEGGAVTKPAGWGNACDDDGDCARGCVTDMPFTNGYCTQINLDCGHPASASTCPWGTTCTQVDAATKDALYVANLCLVNCAVDADCRVSEGYRCCETPRAGYAGPSGRVCVPAPAGCLP
jgi:hypothetical protein